MLAADGPPSKRQLERRKRSTIPVAMLPAIELFILRWRSGGEASDDKRHVNMQRLVIVH
jgi:hypothetical protein